MENDRVLRICGRIDRHGRKLPASQAIEDTPDLFVLLRPIGLECNDVEFFDYFFCGLGVEN